ncbi:MAG: carboxy-S-adenosyl-L-methionine synthase CmoA [Deltaproteobacteria bacterium]|nr:carboxy-S-adenosyl-L-methionine synthase CmoA [Deltaproteobacteria bacterium]
MVPPKDSLYNIENIPEDFDFNENVVEVFDDMLDRSVPFYHEVIQSTAKILDLYLQTKDSICDLGCATGTPLLEFARILKNKDLQFIGIDSSPAMLEKARLKSEFYSKKQSVKFYLEDITKLNRAGTGAFILNYTLQFIRPILRQPLIERLYENLRPGGVLILSEKTILPDKRLNRSFIEIYHNHKRDRGYSELEIAKKREALENILIPFSTSENIRLLIDAGFEPVESFFQWFNFSSIMALKPD